jgi:hypothetical protein
MKLPSYHTRIDCPEFIDNLKKTVDTMARAACVRSSKDLVFTETVREQVKEVRKTAGMIYNHMEWVDKSHTNSVASLNLLHNACNNGTPRFTRSFLASLANLPTWATCSSRCWTACAHSRRPHPPLPTTPPLPTCTPPCGATHPGHSTTPPPQPRPTPTILEPDLPRPPLS